MTTGDMWSPILSCLGTTWSSDASSVSTHFVKNGTKVKEKREAWERRAFSVQTVEVLFSEQKKRTRLLSIFFST